MHPEGRKFIINDRLLAECAELAVNSLSGRAYTWGLIDRGWKRDSDEVECKIA